ncbi:MAG: ABC transporter permease, partial [Longimicrobiales bacterium]
MDEDSGIPPHRTTRPGAGPDGGGVKVMDFQRLFAIARKEALQLRRDTRSLILAFVLPLLMVLFFGYAITWDVKNIQLAVWDQDGTRASRELRDVFEASGYFSIVERPASYREVETGLTRSRVQAALVIPPGYARDLGAGRKVPVQLLLDGSDANTATIAQNYAGAIAARHSTQILLRGREMPPLATAETRIWYNETLESRNMIVPGLVAVIMSIIAAMLTSLTIAREWERGTMEQLASTPVKGVEIVLGKLLPYLLIGFFDVIMVVVAGILVFHVPFRGDP